MPQEAHATENDAAFEKPAPEPITTSKPGLFSRRRLLGPVDKEKGDAALLAHSYVTGMVDAATFANWSVFVGMQTGMCALFSLLLFSFSSSLLVVLVVLWREACLHPAASVKIRVG